MEAHLPHPAALGVYGNYGLYVTNIVMTCFFIVAHSLIMGLMFDAWGGFADGALIAWSALQYLVAIYSLSILWGTVAIQVVLLYFKLYIRIAVFFFLSVSTAFIGITSILSLFGSTALVKYEAQWQLIYGIGLNGPGMMFMWPFIYYLKDLETYIGVNYSNITGQLPQSMRVKSTSGRDDSRLVLIII